MSHYWKRCPHCGRTVEDGYGYPRKQLGDPYRRCRFCSNIYKDRHVIEWETASTFKKAMFYIGNGRLFVNAFVSFCLYLYLKNCTDVEMWATITITSSVFLVIFTLCTLYARHQVKDYLAVFGSYFEVAEDASLDDRYEKYKDDPFGIRKHKDKK